MCPQKTKTNRIRLTFGRKNTVITINCVTPTTNLLTVKLLFNRIISMPGAKFMGMDLKYFYLNPPMDCAEFLHTKLDNFPESVIKQYELRKKVDAEYCAMIRVERRMHRLAHT